VMPGDVVVSDSEGVTFIPPQLCQEVIDRATMIHRVDEWGHLMLRQGKYTPGQIDRKWTKPMIEEFNQWLEQQGSKLRMKEDQ
jgi:4-hydroxy-4-methyl-2-oxoglutarate aldolase